MNQFEQLLLEKGSLELLCSYVETHKEVLSSEFKDGLIERMNPILQACDLVKKATNPENEFLDMDLETFFNRFNSFYYHEGLRKRLLEKCEDNQINTVKDLLNFGRFRVLKMKNVGKKTLGLILDALEEAGIDNF